MVIKLMVSPEAMDAVVRQLAIYRFAAILQERSGK